jgi:RecB family endonuclease NucS
MIKDDYALEVKEVFNFVDYVKVSSKTGENVKSIFKKLIANILISKNRNSFNNLNPLSILNSFNSEKEIEEYLIKHLDLIEPGLQLIKNQYMTPTGRIDILCIDQNLNHVVIEIKKNKAYDSITGQIQRYMFHIEEKMKNANVRGIIIVKELSEKAKYSIKGSKYPLKIYEFKELNPKTSTLNTF